MQPEITCRSHINYEDNYNSIDLRSTMEWNWSFEKLQEHLRELLDRMNVLVAAHNKALSQYDAYISNETQQCTV